MVKKTVELCDICGESVAIGKCAICGRSLCKNHAYLVKADVFTDEFRLSFKNPVTKKDLEKTKNPIFVCKDCLGKITEIFSPATKEGEERKERLAKALLEAIEKVAIEEGV